MTFTVEEPGLRMTQKILCIGSLILQGSPTISWLTNRLGKSQTDWVFLFKTARDYLAKLEQAGMLREITGYARNRIFQADEIMKLF